jgi:hypothetical protein
MPTQKAHIAIDYELTAQEYADPSYVTLERELASLRAAGAGPDKLATHIQRIYAQKNRTIRNIDFRRLAPDSVADDYLLPRKDLNRFVVETWVRHIFLAGLKKTMLDRVFLFGLGRLFSNYNDLGAQHSTDVDLNLILDDTLSDRDLSALAKSLKHLQHEFHARFGIVLELHPDYTIKREREILALLSTAEERIRLASALFYRTNERSIRILNDHPRIRENIFSKVRLLPDACIFEHFLGFASGKTSYAKLRSDAEPLTIGLDGSCDRLSVHTVLGSRSFGYWHRRHFPQGLFVAPPEWHFSMKYFVNRVYDYVCSMRNAGYTLEQIGFSRKSGKGKADPDYLYLRNAHKLMLYLQELVQTGIGAYGIEVDYSWMSGNRFQRLVALKSDSFLNDFDALVLEGGLLRPSEAERYRFLKGKIAAKAKDRYLEGPLAKLKTLPKDLHYEVLNNEGSRYRICIPYTWSDLGFFAFSAISVHIAQIVEGRLLPTLAPLGMPVTEIARYKKAFSESRDAG